MSGRTARHLQQMIAELGFDRTLYRIQISAEHDPAELRNHVALIEFSQVATLSGGWAAGVLSRDVREGCTVENLLFEAFALFPRRDEDVSRSCTWHDVLPVYILFSLDYSQTTRSVMQQALTAPISTKFCRCFEARNPKFEYRNRLETRISKAQNVFWSLAF
jgi:hypothetical protein